MSGREYSEAYSLDSISAIESHDSRMQVSDDDPLIQLSNDEQGHTLVVNDISLGSHDSGLADRDLISSGHYSINNNDNVVSPQLRREHRGRGQDEVPYRMGQESAHSLQQLYIAADMCPVVMRSREDQTAIRNYELMFGQRTSGRGRYRPTKPPAGRVHCVSEMFYDESGDQRQNAPPELYVSFDEEPRRAQMKQSKKLPGWAWYLISKSLGIKTHPNKKPIFATFLHVLTLLFGFAFLVAYTWHKVYDVVSVMTKSTVLTGMVEIVICLCWVALTIYANKCAARLFSSRNFVRSVRVHSKTIFKLSAVGVIGVLGVSFMAVNSYHAVSSFQDQHCLAVNLSTVICKVVYPARVSFNLFGIIWNLLVASVLLSVCRTHTVGIRRFIKELEIDGKRYENFWKEKISGTFDQPLLRIDDVDAMSDSELGSEWLVWEEQNSPENSDNGDGLRRRGRSSTGERRGSGERRGTGDSQRSGDRQSTADSHPDERRNLSDMSTDKAGTTDSPHPGMPQGNPALNAGQVDQPDCPVRDNVFSDTNIPPIMTNEDILLCYWKISCRMRVTSLCLQRWLSSWIAFVVLWCANYVIYWTSHDATIIAIVEFVIPLLMIPLLASAYAEANTEGQRMIRSICPVQERLPLLFYLGQQPLQMTVFNFPVTYQGIVGVIAAFSVAFASRIILDEVIVK